jgi:hypothetical protein
MSLGTVKILRGIPGSGKTYLANRLVSENGDKALVCSADDFWWVGTGAGRRWVFDPARIGEAHADCFRRFVEALTGFPLPHLIIVDNTNIHAWEIAPYVLAACAFGYQVEIVTIWADLPVALANGTHGVPPERVLSMHQDLLTEKLPPFWKQSVVLSGYRKSVDLGHVLGPLETP